MKKVAALAFGILLLASCEKKKLKIPTIDPPPDPMPSLYDCHMGTIWNDSLTQSNLLGDWMMTKIYNPWLGLMPAENVMLSFIDDSTLVVTQDTIITNQRYHLELIDSNIYSIVTDSFNMYTNGRLMFCADSMECSNSFVDGLDYFYLKIK